MFNNTRIFLSNVRSEFKKVTWPTRNAVKKHTGVVLYFSCLIAIILGAVDYGLASIVQTIFGG